MGQHGDTVERGKWMALTAALLGWMFDGFEQGLFSQVGRPALRELLNVTDEALVAQWFSIAVAGFLVGAAAGGVLFGWLGDRIGRVRAMTLSVITYAVFSGLCGFSTSAVQIAILRFFSSVGMGGEWSLGVALVMEIWPDRSRSLMAGLIGAAANVGYLLLGFVGVIVAKYLDAIGAGLSAIGLSDSIVDPLVRNSGWRLIMILGAAPALLTFFFRIFVPESEKWEREQGRGATSHWAARDLVGIVVGVAGALGIIFLWATPLALAVQIGGTLAGLALITVCYCYPIVRYLQRSEEDLKRAIPTASENTTRARIAAEGITQAGSASEGILAGSAREGLSQSRSVSEGDAHSPRSLSQRSSEDVRSPSNTAVWLPTVRRMLLGACLGGVPLIVTWSSVQWSSVWTDQLSGVKEAKAYTQLFSAFGAILGCIAGALLGGWLGRRITYFLLCSCSLVAALFFFLANDQFGAQFLISNTLLGFFSASFYGWLPLYLPELFATRIRATGQGFSYNFGRNLAVVGALATGNLTGALQGRYNQACAIMSLMYLIGMAIIWLAPETRGKPLPE
jgi:MFS family permease